MRVDGLLLTVAAPVHVPPQAVVSRVEILAGLNIAERRLPQDGVVRLRADRADIDIRSRRCRLSTVIPRSCASCRAIADYLTFQNSACLRLMRDVARPSRLAERHDRDDRPTGSGNTTTLATMLFALNLPLRKISPSRTQSNMKFPASIKPK